LGFDRGYPGWSAAEIIRCGLTVGLKINLKSTIFVVIAISSGLIVLLGYFVDFLTGFRLALLQGAVVLAAVVLLVGVFNLASVHWRRFKSGQKGASYSLLLLISLITTLLVVGISIVTFGLDSEYTQWLFNYLQVPIERSLMAILAIVLVYAVARMLSRRLNIFSLIFIITLLLVLISTISLPLFESLGIRESISRAAQVISSSGARGILIGVAMGTIATGLRILIGADRPYGD